ncbi:hypothetical protein AB6A40_010079 [Gnathostoma spinigerum]|uniref:C2H2-type domain-containing protein n=1 Tax=Gnathostoma spinigerum TaxID=75299 RepID=A0ABD6F2P9_9BILA
MVSTHSQYLSEFNSPLPSAVDAGKSPLAMLAKTCETIGLPDTPVRKGNHEKSKDEQSPSSSSNSTVGVVNGSVSNETKKGEISPVLKKKEGSKSPRHSVHSPSNEKKTPISSEPSTSSASLPASFQAMLNARNCFPMSFPPLPAGFPSFASYPSMMSTFPAMPSFPTTFPTSTLNPFLRCPDPLTCKSCPASMLARPCVTPGCTSCVMHNPTASSATDMMMGFPQSFFAAYNPLMPTALPPTSNSAAAQIAYQNLMAAASGQTTKHVCNWVESPTSVCGKSFSTADELAAHMKVAHAPSVSTPSTTPTSQEAKCSSPRSASTPLFSHTSMRYHPYMKPTGTILPSATMPNPLSIPPFPAMPGFPSAATLQAMYTQRLMATMPHP